MDGFLWVYDRDEKEFRRQKPINTAVRKHYYSLDLPDGRRDHVPEVTMGMIEGNAKPVFDALIAQRAILASEREAAIQFLALLACRVSRFERETSEVATALAKRYIRDKLTDGERRTDFTQSEQELLEFVSGDELVVLPPRNFTIERMGKEVLALAEAIQSWAWIVAHPPEGTAFVTCDAPFAMLAEDELEVPLSEGTVQIHAVVPIAPSTAILFSRTPGLSQHINTGTESTRRLNLFILRETESYALARDERDLRSLVEAAGLANDGAPTRVEVEFLDDARAPKVPKIRTKRYREER
jgi:hypothetical protein